MESATLYIVAGYQEGETDTKIQDEMIELGWTEKQCEEGFERVKTNEEVRTNTKKHYINLSLGRYSGLQSISL